MTENEELKIDYSLDVATSNQHQIRISNAEWFEISLALEQHHAVFYKIWQMGKPIFNEDIPTAAVQFDDKGDFIWFHFNPQFWKRLDFYNKLWVICHEALHIVLNHGVRTQDSGVNRKATNIALDIVVNESLSRGFGFERDKIEGWEDYCYVDTVFKNKKPQPTTEESYEFYYNLFDKVYGHGGPGDGTEEPGTVDDHSFMGEKSDNWGPIIDELNEGLSDDEKESLKRIVNKHFQNDKKDKLNQKAGVGTGGQWAFTSGPKVKKKKKWETIIKKWSKKYLIEKDKDVEQWARLNRRLAMLPRNMFLPSEMEFDDNEKEKKRIKVYFFLDTSGSCWGLKDRFFTAAESLPPEKFDIRLLCFDTTVVETTLESRKIYGGGGTSFKILEEFIQKEVNQGAEYPVGIFCISDGYADNIRPQYPDRWHFFLTAGGIKQHIDKGCFIHNLEDFE